MTATSPKPDDIDELLATFYRGEMPSPWPRWQPPAGRTAPAAKSTATLAQGRAVLTAAILALIAGTWFVAGWRPVAPTPDAGLNDATATRPADWKLTDREPAGKAKPSR